LIVLVPDMRRPFAAIAQHTGNDYNDLWRIGDMRLSLKEDHSDRKEQR
jgi:hypothetical protein